MGQTAAGIQRISQSDPSRAVLRLLRLLAHEASQPLTLALGEAELALRNNRGEAELRKSVQRCFQALQQLGRLFSDFRLVAETNDATISNTWLPELIAEIRDSLSLAAEGKGCVVTCRIASGIRLRTDREMLRRAVAAVVEKAITASVPGSIIEIELERSREAAALSVSYLELNSERRGGTAGPTHTGSSGLAWTIPQAMIRVLGGELHAETELPNASERRVMMRLPLSSKARIPVGRPKCRDETAMRQASRFSH